MARSGPLGWIEWAGSELANEARTLTYAATLPGPAEWEVRDPASCVCDVLFETDAGSTIPFVDPAMDAAPWYDAGVPASAHFYGALGLQAEGLDSPLTREVIERGGGLGGANFGPQRTGPRRMTFRAWIVGATCEGVNYGLAWLSHRLAQLDCATCGTSTMRLRLSCPDVGSPWDTDLVELRECALISGPTETQESQTLGCCELRQYEWVVVAGNPWYYGCEVTCLARTVVLTAQPAPLSPDPECGPTHMAFEQWYCEGPAPFCCWFGAAGAFGVTAPIVTIETGSGAVCDVTLYASDGATTLFSMTLTGLPRHSTVVIDCVSRSIKITDAAGNVCDGLGLVELDGGTGFEWPQLCPDGPADERCLLLCVQFGRWCCVHADTALTIAAGSRYLAGAAPCRPVLCPGS